MVCADAAAVDVRPSSNVYEVNPLLWHFRLSNPRLGELTVGETADRKKNRLETAENFGWVRQIAQYEEGKKCLLSSQNDWPRPGSNLQPNLDAVATQSLSHTQPCQVTASLTRTPALHRSR